MTRDWLGYGFRVAPRLETERLILRGFETRDLDPLCEILREPEVHRYFGDTPQPREDTKRRVMAAVGSWALLGIGFMAVERKADGMLMGQAGLLSTGRDMAGARDDIPEMGWMMRTAAQGQGYAAEACRAIIDWTRQSLGAPDLWAIINPDNAPSIALAQRLGFVRELDSVYGGEPISVWLRQA